MHLYSEMSWNSVGLTPRNVDNRIAILINLIFSFLVHNITARWVWRTPYFGRLLQMVQLFSFCLPSCAVWASVQKRLSRGWGGTEGCCWDVPKWIQEKQKQCFCRKWRCQFWLSSWEIIQEFSRKEVLFWKLMNFAHTWKEWWAVQ